MFSIKNKFNCCLPKGRHVNVLKTTIPSFCTVQVSPSGSPLHHLFLLLSLLHVASIGPWDVFVLGDTWAQREGPILISPLSSHHWTDTGVALSLRPPRLVPAWLAGLMANRARCPTHGTPAEWAYWRGNRLALSVPDGYPALLPAGPPPPLSLSTDQGQSLCPHLSNTNYQCVVDLREWQKPLLGNLYQKGEVMLSVVLFLVRIRLGFFSANSLWVMCVAVASAWQRWNNSPMATEPTSRLGKNVWEGARVCEELVWGCICHYMSRG